MGFRTPIIWSSFSFMEISRRWIFLIKNLLEKKTSPQKCYAVAHTPTWNTNVSIHVLISRCSVFVSFSFFSPLCIYINFFYSLFSLHSVYKNSLMSLYFVIWCLLLHLSPPRGNEVWMNSQNTGIPFSIECWSTNLKWNLLTYNVTYY